MPKILFSRTDLKDSEVGTDLTQQVSVPGGQIGRHSSRTASGTDTKGREARIIISQTSQYTSGVENPDVHSTSTGKITTAKADYSFTNFSTEPGIYAGLITKTRSMDPSKAVGTHVTADVSDKKKHKDAIIVDIK